MIKFRLRVAFIFLRLAVWSIDKATAEGLSLVIAIQNWLDYLEELQAS